MEVLARQMERGCGLVLLHYSTFIPSKKGGENYLQWIGGYFDYDNGPDGGWYSKIRTATTTPRPATPAHPICRGLRPFRLHEEYYYNMRFRRDDPRWVPILTTPIPGESVEQVVAWAVQRDDGGRGFGFTGGHLPGNWKLDNFRKMVLNAIVWTANVPVPAGGVETVHPENPPASNDDCCLNRGFQNYVLYGSTVETPYPFGALSANVDWQWISTVATDKQNQTTVEITGSSGSLGTYRHLLWEVFSPDDASHDFYGEFDVYATPVPEPSTLALAMLALLGVCLTARRWR